MEIFIPILPDLLKYLLYFDQNFRRLILQVQFWMFFLGFVPANGRVIIKISITKQKIKTFHLISV